MWKIPTPRNDVPIRMIRKPPSVLSVTIFELLINDDDSVLNKEFDAAWDYAMHFFRPDRGHSKPHRMVDASAALEILLEKSRASAKHALQCGKSPR